MSAANFLSRLTVDLVLGPEDYLFGEEKAMLEVIGWSQARASMYKGARRRAAKLTTTD